MMIPNIVHAVVRLERVGVVLKKKTGSLMTMSMQNSSGGSRRRRDGMKVPTVVYIRDHCDNSHHGSDDDDDGDYDFNESFLHGDCNGDVFEREACYPTVLPRDIVEWIMTRTIESDSHTHDIAPISAAAPSSPSSTSTSTSSSSSS
jgi:hypothetical protein